jgi:nitroreductase
MDHPCFNEAAAVCIMVSPIQTLMVQGGPDTYRLAHLEAGTAESRLALSARALGLSTYSTMLFYDDDTRKYLGLSHTAWEPIFVTALGVPPPNPGNMPPPARLDEGDWRG